MTFSEIKELMTWARTNQIAHLKIHTGEQTPGVEVTFYPDKSEAMPSMPHAVPTQLHRIDEMMGLEGLDKEFNR